MNANLPPQARVDDLALIKIGIEVDECLRCDHIGTVLRALKKLSEIDTTAETLTILDGVPLGHLLHYYQRQVTAGSLAALGAQPPFILLPKMVTYYIPIQLANPVRVGAPIQKLPHEIVSFIIELVYKDELDDDPSRLNHAPTLLSHVNRAFRRAAVSTSNFWSAIVLRKRDPDNRMETFVERANISLLDIHLDIPPYTPGASDLSTIFKLILPASRWSKLRLWYRDRVTLDMALASCTSAAMTLTDIALVNTDLTNLHDEPHPPPTLFLAPSLENLTVIGTPVLWRQDSLRNLKSLDVQWHPVPMKATVQDWTELLRSSPELESLAIKASGPFVPDDFDLARHNCSQYEVELAGLRHLYLGNLFPESLLFLLQTIQAPNLRSFGLVGVLFTFSFDQGCDILQSLQHNKIRALRFERSAILDELFIFMLMVFNDIEELELYGPDGHIEKMNMHDTFDNDLIIPGLRRLTVRHHSHETLLAFLEQRVSIGARVEEILLDEYDEDGTFGVLQSWAHIDRTSLNK